MAAVLTSRLALIALVACSSHVPDPPKPEPAAATAPKVAATAPPSEATQETAQAAYDAKQWDLCAERFLEVAKASVGDQRSLAFDSAACCYARGGKPDLAFATMDKAVAAGLRSIEQVQVDTDFAGLHGDPRWGKLISAMQHAIPARESTLKAPELRRDLLALVKEDQAVRMAYIDQQKKGGHADWSPVAAIDDRTTKVMRTAIAKYGWPGKTTVSDDGAHAAWLLIQHSKDLALQKDALARMASMVDTGEVDKTDYAYLDDRVAVAEHRKQRYGTQFNGSEPEPIDDEANVDARRRAMGLGSMAEYKQQMVQTYGPHWPTEAAKK